MHWPSGCFPHDCCTAYRGRCFLVLSLTHPFSLICSLFSCLLTTKHLLQLIPKSSLTTTDVITFSMILPFSQCQINGDLGYVDFLLSLDSSTSLQFGHIRWWVTLSPPPFSLSSLSLVFVPWLLPISVTLINMCDLQL